MNTNQRLAASVGVAVLLFGTVNLLGNTLLSPVRLDLTQEKLYTLSPGAKAIARGLDEPIRLEYYATSALRNQSPQLAGFMRRAEDVLGEFVRASAGKLELVRFDPEAFSEAEDDAELAGLQRLALPGGGDEGFFGLVMRNPLGDKQVIPSFDPSAETFLEYEIAQRLLALDDPSKPVIGLVTALPMQGGMPAAPGQRPAPAWQIMAELERQFDVRSLGTGFSDVEDDVDLLMLVHPSGLAQETLYAIDQYALGGGKVLALVDPFCAVDQSSAAAGGPQPSDLGPLLSAWGVTFDAANFAADRKLARAEQDGSTMLFAMRIPNDSVDTTDPVTALLTDVEFFTPGILAPQGGATTTFTPLVRTTAEAARMSLADLQFGMDPAQLEQNFHPGFEPLTLAARVRGPITTAFVNGPAQPDGSPSESAPEGHVAESTTDFEAIVIADADFLFDGLWLTRSIFGTVKARENPDFLLNAAEQLSGNDALLGLRARGTFERPFEKVRELRQQARERLRDEEERLESDLTAAQARIDEIVREQGDGNTVLLTPELEEQLVNAREAEVATRKKLRQVRYDLVKDERRLGTTLKLVNIGFVPLLVVGAGVAMMLGRRRMRATKTA
jgi:ABC-type uncharacterized transport system involved in gliding motility auxiliary subunit